MNIIKWSMLFLLLAGCASQLDQEETIEQTTIKYGILQIDAGGSASTVLKSDGTVCAVGKNNVGQLGDGTKINSVSIKQISDLKDIVSIAGDSDHSLAITKDGSVWGWGYNSKGEITQGEQSILKPIQIKGLKDIIHVSTGGYHSLALDKSGSVWSWGDNTYGQLGNGTNQSSSIPVKIETLNDIVAVGAGGSHSLAITKDGKIWCWGRNSFYQLGNGSTKNSNVPVMVNNLSGVSVISAGDNHSLAVTLNGEVWGWGYNSNGQVGDGSNNIYEKDGSLKENHNSSEPKKINGFNGKVKFVSAGFKHSIALNEDGEVYVWGWNQYGQLGNGTTIDSNIPVKNNKINGKIVKIDTGYYHSFAVDNKGIIHAWGDDTYGQLGDGSTKRFTLSPVVVEMK